MKNHFSASSRCLIVAISFAVANLGHAALILTFNNASVSGGTQNSFSGLTGTTNPNTVSFSVSAIDLAGDSSANDTLTVSFSLEGNNGHPTTGNDAFGVNGGGTNTRLDVGQSLQFSLDTGSLSATFGDGQDLVAQFDGFVGFSVLSAPGSTFDVNGNDVTGGGPHTFAALTTMTILHEADSDLGQTPRITDIQASFTATAIPEPSTFALILVFLVIASMLHRGRRIACLQLSRKALSEGVRS